MAVKSLYFKDAAPSGATTSLSLQDGGTAPTGANTTTGWQVASTAVNNMSALVARTKSSTFSSSDAIGSFNAANCWRSENPFSGTFANASWTLAFRVRAVTRAGTQTGAVKVRIWKSANAAGTGATQLTTAVLVGTTTAVLSTTVSATSTVTWAPGATVALNNEYLWIQCEWNIGATGGNPNCDAMFYVESAGVVTTPNFTAAYILAAAAGSYALVAPATPVLLKVARKLDATTAGSYALVAGTTPVTISRRKTVNALAGSYSLTGTAAKLTNSTPSGSWTPALLPTGMIHWYDAADSATLAFTGSNLTAWADKSPSPITATPVNGPSIGPTLSSINGLSALHFYEQPLKGHPGLVMTDFTVFALFENEAGYVWERLVDHNVYDGWWLARYSGTNDWGGGVTNGGPPFGIQVTLPDNTINQITIMRSGSTQQVSANGNTPVTQAVPGPGDAFREICLGGYGGSTTDALHGKIGEVLVWSVPLSADDYAKTEGYLAWKWGLQALLPVDHPYKAAPPTTGGSPPAAYSLTADAGSYTLTGADAALTKDGGLVNKSIPAGAGSYALTGTDAALIIRSFKTIAAAAGSYSLSGAVTNDLVIFGGGKQQVIFGYTDGEGAGQSFTSVGTQITAVTPYVAKAASPPDGLVAKIWTSVANLPGTLLGTSTPVPSSAIPPTTSAPVRFDFPTPVAVDVGTQYSVTITRTGTATFDNFYIFGYGGTDSYAGGQFISFQYGGSWTAYPGFDAWITIHQGAATATQLLLGHKLNAATAGAYALTGADAALTKDGGLVNKSIPAGAGSYALTGAATTTLLVRRKLDTTTAGNYALTGAATTLLKRGLRVLATTAGSYALVAPATPVLLKRGLRVLATTAGSYSLTGAATTALLRKPRLTAGVGSYLLTGTNASLLMGAAKALNAEAGSYSLTGTTVGFKRTYRATVAAGSYSLTGAATTLLTYRRTVVATIAGSYSLTGAATALRHGYKVVATIAGSYALTGAATTALLRGRKLAANSNSYSLTGSDVALAQRTPKVLAAAAGSYSLTGSSAALTKRAFQGITAVAGAYTLTGTAAVLRKGKLLAANSNNYTLTGATVGLLHKYRLIAATASYSVTGTDAVLRKGGAQQIQPGFFLDPDSFYPVAVTGVQILRPELYLDPDQFFPVNVSYKQYLTPTLFLDPDYFPQALVSVFFEDTEVICAGYEDRRMHVPARHRLMIASAEDRTMDALREDRSMDSYPRRRAC